MAIRSGEGRIRLYLRATDYGTGIAANVWHISHGGAAFTIEDDPFQTGSWNWDTVVFQPTPAFGWDRVQLAGPGGGATVTINTWGHKISMSGTPPTASDDYLRIAFPHWLPVSLFGFLPALAVLRFAATHWRRYRRLLAGTCPMCAYDLRATPGHCPECGWVIHAAREAGQGHPPQRPLAEPRGT